MILLFQKFNNNKCFNSSIDPERHGLVTAFFLERRMKELRKLGLKRASLSKEEPFADALLEFCEGFLGLVHLIRPPSKTPFLDPLLRPSSKTTY